MFATHYMGNPVAYKQKVGIVHGITNLFSSLSLVLKPFDYWRPKCIFS